MARYSGGMTAAGAGTSLRPVLGLLSTASVTGVLREIALFNTTATACVYRVVRFTGGTAGADQAEAPHRENAPAASCVLKGLWTADATIDQDLGYRIQIGAAIGSGGIFTMGVEGLETFVGSTKGIGLIPVGTGQVCEVYFAWDE
jgi:hypothetical protein